MSTPTPSNSVVTDLLPCPICASEKVFLQNSDVPDPGVGDGWKPLVWCSACGLSTRHFDTDEAATAFWNTRPLAMQSANTTASDELAEDIRYIAAHTNDPRFEERLYEAADVIDAANAIRRLGYGLSAPQSEHVATTALNAIATPDTDRVAVLEDAERFRALMRCPRIKMQGSCGVDPKNGGFLYAEPGSVHFGAEFWPTGEADAQTEPTWGRNALRALADDILRAEAAALSQPLGSQENGNG